MHKRTHFFILTAIAVLNTLLPAISPAQAKEQSITDEAQRLFQDNQRSVYQIRVIDLATGKKSSIGSGFQFSPDGHLATNYHVLCLAIHYPQRFRLEYAAFDGSSGPVKILDVDIIRDIGIVKKEGGPAEYLELGKSDLLKGTKIFSMGNPYDLGMSIIEGTYNGLMEKSLYRKILFSGSINPGMSGGPAIDHEGRVIGVNVATAGNEVSFLVPVEPLKDLYTKMLENQPEGMEGIADFNKRIEQQLMANQDDYISKILDVPWESIPMGEAYVPGDIANAFKCWGESKDEEDKLYNYAFVNCSSEDKIFVSPTLSTGQIIYKYNWMTSKGLNPIRFYNLYQSSFATTEEYTNATEEDTKNFNCTEGFVNIDHAVFKTHLCARAYKKFPKLFDINLSLASVHLKDRGLMAEVIALGLSQEKAKELVKKFMESMKWPKP